MNEWYDERSLHECMGVPPPNLRYQRVSEPVVKECGESDDDAEGDVHLWSSKTSDLADSPMGGRPSLGTRSPTSSPNACVSQ